MRHKVMNYIFFHSYLLEMHESEEKVPTFDPTLAQLDSKVKFRPLVGHSRGSHMENYCDRTFNARTFIFGILIAN